MLQLHVNTGQSMRTRGRSKHGLSDVFEYIMHARMHLCVHIFVCTLAAWTVDEQVHHE